MESSFKNEPLLERTPYGKKKEVWTGIFILKVYMAFLIV